MPTLNKSTRPPWVPERKAHEGRRSPNQAIYNSPRWRGLSKLHKKANPLCVECEAKGIVAAVYVTDHIVPINKGGAPYEWSNLQSLCRRCHDSKSGREAHDDKGGAV